MATATLITIPVYKIGSQNVISRTLYPYGFPWVIAADTLSVQPNTGTTVGQLVDGTTALLYSSVKSSITGDVAYYSNLRPSDIAALANA